MQRYGLTFVTVLLLSFARNASAGSTIDLGQPIGQLRAVPVSLGPDQPKAVAALYGADAEIDPYIGMFFFPKSTLKLVLFDETGKRRWGDVDAGHMDTRWAARLGPNVMISRLFSLVELGRNKRSFWRNAPHPFESRP